MFPIRDLNPTKIRPVVSYALIALNVLVFLLWQPQGRAVWQTGTDLNADAEFLYAHAVVPCEVTSGDPLTTPEIFSGICGEGGSEVFPGKQVYVSPVTSMFLHGGLFHLVTNMWVLWIFGNNIEEAYGHLRYLLMYLATGLVATMAFIALRPEATTPLVGASGAIAGVLGAYLILHPRARVLSLIGFFWIMPLPAWLFLGGWFAFQFANTDPSVAWEAHVFGFLAGVAITVVARLTGGARQRR